MSDRHIFNVRTQKWTVKPRTSEEERDFDKKRANSRANQEKRRAARNKMAALEKRVEDLEAALGASVRRR